MIRNQSILAALGEALSNRVIATPTSEEALRHQGFIWLGCNFRASSRHFKSTTKPQLVRAK
jgi:hypothetical protein